MARKPSIAEQFAVTFQREHGGVTNDDRANINGNLRRALITQKRAVLKAMRVVGGLSCDGRDAIWLNEAIAAVRRVR